MLLATTDTIPGKTVTQCLGLVRGNTIRGRHVGKDLLAALRNRKMLHSKIRLCAKRSRRLV